MEQPIQPIVPEGTPLPPAPVGVPPYPITPFAVWTWSTPVIPEFYWNIYSAEQRIKQICKEIGKIEAYLQYLVNATNSNIIELHKRIDVLTERVAALEKHVEEEVARLDALIAQLRADLEQEIQDREAGDEALGERIDQEILDRTHGDQTLHQEIADEATARTHADDTLHDEISTETQARIHADDALHEEISHRLLPTDVQAGDEISITRPDPESNTIVIASTVAHSISELASTVSGLQAALTSETSERRADDAALWTAVNNRIERDKILAGTGIKVENDPDSSTVTISATGGGAGGGSTTVTGTAPVEVSGTPEDGYTVGVSAATEDAAGVISEARVKELAPEVEAGEGLRKRENTLSLNLANLTVKPSLQGTMFVGDIVTTGSMYNKIAIGPFNQHGDSAISHGVMFSTEAGDESYSPGFGIGIAAGFGLRIDPSSGYLEVEEANEYEAGIISEARVKELASGPSLSAEEPLKLEDGELSLTKDPAGPVTSSSAGISVREITPDTESETETGVVSKETIKSLAQYSGAVNDEFGLDGSRPGGLRILAGQGMDFGVPRGYASGEDTPLGSKGLGVSRALPDGSLADTTLVGRFVVNPHSGSALPEPDDNPMWIPLAYENRNLKVNSTMVFPWLDPSDYDMEVRAMPDSTSTFWRFYVRKVDGSSFPSDAEELRDVNLHLSTLTFANYVPTE